MRRHLPYPCEHARQHQQMADIRGRDVKVPVGGQRIEGGFTAQACAIELKCLRYGRRRRNGDRGRLEASPGPDPELIPEMVAELLVVPAQLWLGNVARFRRQSTAPSERHALHTPS